MRIKKFNNFIFEDIHLDNILDKISKSGYDKLTPYEKEYLDKYSKGSHDEMKKDKEKREKSYSSAFNYDPRKDEFFADMGDLIHWTDDEIENGRYNILWDELDKRDQSIFFNDYKIDSVYSESSWEKLPNDTKEKFIKFINQYK